MSRSALEFQGRGLLWCPGPLTAALTAEYRAKYGEAHALRVEPIPPAGGIPAFRVLCPTEADLHRAPQELLAHPDVTPVEDRLRRGESAGGGPDFRLMVKLPVRVLNKKCSLPFLVEFTLSPAEARSSNHTEVV